MDIKQAFALALKKCRKAKGLTQEDFGIVSSRTYLSTLERGLKSPTLEKVDDIANHLGINPLTILALTYLDSTDLNEIKKIQSEVMNEIEEIIKSSD